jgi:exodeoxyribonuclease-5
MLVTVTETVAMGIASAYERRFSEAEWDEIIELCLALDWVGRSPERDAVRRALAWRSIDVSTLVIPLMLEHPRLPGSGRGLGFKLREYRNDLMHRRVEDDGRERWSREDRVHGLLDDGERLLIDLESDNERYELREIVAWIRSGRTGVPESVPSKILFQLEPAARREVSSRPPPPATRPTERPLVLSPDQRAALDAIEAWYRGPKEARTFTLAGPAGSGKTTLVREALRQLQLVPDEVLLATYTSKAREVLRSKVPDSFAPRCLTLSKLLWKFRIAATADDGEDMRFKRVGPKAPQPRISLVIVDEASMVTERDREQLERHYRTLFIGDPNQLPPVIPAEGEGSEDRDSGVLLTPDASLEVVHRQDSRSGILAAAGRARAGEQLEFAGFDRDGVRILDEGDGAISPARFRELLRGHDVILTSRNRTRILVNGVVRRLSGRAEFPGDHDPKPGDLLVCTANQELPGGRRIENGERIRVTAVLGRLSVRPDRPDLEDIRLRGTVEGRGGEELEMIVSSQMLAGLHLKGGGREDTRDISGPRSGVVRCEWGYALTVHKAQGSEWDRVLVLDDAASDERMDPRRRDYTAFTRARSTLTVLALATPSRLLAEWDR